MDFLFFGLMIIFLLAFISVSILFLIRLFLKKKPRGWIYVLSLFFLLIGGLASMVGFGSQPEVREAAKKKEEKTNLVQLPKEQTVEDEALDDDRTSDEIAESTTQSENKRESNTTDTKKQVSLEKVEKKEETNILKKPETLEEKAKQIAYEVFKSGGDTIDKTVKEVYFEDDDNSLTIIVEGKDGWSDISIGQGFYEDSTTLYRELSKDDKIDELWITIVFPMKDTNGKISDEEVMGTWMSRETMNKIDWKTFNYQKILDVVDGKTIYPQFVQ